MGFRKPKAFQAPSLTQSHSEYSPPVEGVPLDGSHRTLPGADFTPEFPFGKSKRASYPLLDISLEIAKIKEISGSKLLAFVEASAPDSRRGLIII